MDLVKELLPYAIWAAALGALLGVAGNSFVGWVSRKKSVAANWDALHAEIELCHSMAVSYVQELEQTGISLPLSRWPSAFHPDSLKHIIAEREIDANEIQPIMAFYGIVDQINRGFEQAVKARDREIEGVDERLKAGDGQAGEAKLAHPWARPMRVRHWPERRSVATVLLRGELARLRLKIDHLRGTNDQNDVYRAAAAIVQRHRARFNTPFWRLLFLRRK